MHIKDIGRIRYHDALEIQRDSVRSLQEGRGDETLYLLEHEHVVTLGRNATMASLVASRELLALQGVELVETDRGGDITYHGPGQLVGYPILALEEGRRDIRRYVSDVEEALIRTLAAFDINGRRDPVHRGVWVEDHKIASVGIRISRWVTSHGFALNVSTDLSYFRFIVPCGIAGCRMTTIANEIGQTVDMVTVKNVFVTKFCEVFGRTAIDGPANEQRKEGSTAHG
jgi:lipoyl(octanoyl) transferase